LQVNVKATEGVSPVVRMIRFTALMGGILVDIPSNEKVEGHKKGRRNR
jgi:hypothetical protein